MACKTTKSMRVLKSKLGLHARVLSKVYREAVAGVDAAANHSARCLLDENPCRRGHIGIACIHPLLHKFAKALYGIVFDKINPLSEAVFEVPKAVGWTNMADGICRYHTNVFCRSMKDQPPT